MTRNDTICYHSDNASDPYSGLNCGRTIFITTKYFRGFPQIMLSDVLTAVAVKNSIFWNITPSIQVKDNRRFGGTYRLRFQGRRVSETRRQHEADSKQSKQACCLLRAGSLFVFLFHSEDAGNMSF
jgi:hypothetical protein